MNIANKFREYHNLVKTQTNGDLRHNGDISQAAAMLVLAEVLQGTTHSVDITFDNGKGKLDIEAGVGGVFGSPVQVEQR